MTGQDMPAPSTTDAANLLAARRSLRGADGDGAYLDHFVQMLCRLDTARHGFRADDLAAVEAAWISEASKNWSGGFVAWLKDGRRIHVDGRAGSSHWSEDSDIEADVLDASQALPELAARYGWQSHAWDEGTARGLNALLDHMATRRS
jgi:hypothetical protein